VGQIRRSKWAKSEERTQGFGVEAPLSLQQVRGGWGGGRKGAWPPQGSVEEPKQISPTGSSRYLGAGLPAIGRAEPVVEAAAAGAEPRGCGVLPRGAPNKRRMEAS
jgi:hypothetical protein